MLNTWFSLTYGSPTKLLVRNQQPIRSERGVQQGDPLGPFLFSLALQPVLEKAAAVNGCCVLAYLDDVYVCGTPDKVGPTIRTLLTEAHKIGLKSNLSKCWATGKLVVDTDEFTVNPRPSVLGAPLDVEEELPVNIIPKDLMLKVADLPDLQISLRLLRYIHNSRFTYLFRLSSEPASKSLAKGMMEATKRAFSRMLDCDDIPEAAWRQSLLPTGPGVGFMDLTKLAPFMAFASILESTDRLSQLDPVRFGNLIEDEYWKNIKNETLYHNYSEAKKVLADARVANMKFANLQHFFASHVVAPKAVDSFIADKNIPKTAKVIVNSTIHSPIAPQLFAAIPTENDLRLSSPEMRIALCLLLGIPLGMKAETCDCKKGRQLTMYHALSCKSHGKLIERHDKVKRVLADMCTAADFDFEVEPRQALSGNKLRPDILIRYGKDDGYDMALDLTIDNPLRDDSAINTSLKDEQKFLMQNAIVKRHKYDEQCSRNLASFTPIVLSAFGGIFEESYNDAILFMIRKIPSKEFEPPNWAAPDKKTYWLQRIAIALWKGNARQMGSFIKKQPVFRC